MEYYIAWGKQDCERPGRRAKKTTFDVIRIEVDSLSSARSRASREMKKDSRMERYIRSEFEGVELAPPRWGKWSDSFPYGSDMLRTVKKSEGMDYPVMYANPQNHPGSENQHPGHFGWVSVTWMSSED